MSLPGAGVEEVPLDRGGGCFLFLWSFEWATKAMEMSSLWVVELFGVSCRGCLDLRKVEI